MSIETYAGFKNKYPRMKVPEFMYILLIILLLAAVTSIGYMSLTLCYISVILSIITIPEISVFMIVFAIWIYSFYNIHIYLHYAHAFLIGCAKDTFPKNLKRNCKRKYPCALLAKRKKCHTTYWQAMNAACKRQLTVWYRAKLVRTQCKKSCNNCVRK